jgi:hypothetical protein
MSKKTVEEANGEPSAYANIAQQAETAVAGINDPELKKIAFGKIIDALLAGTVPAKSTPRSTRSRQSVNREKNGGSGPQAYIEDLRSEDFFAERRTIADVRTALANRGHHIPATSLSGPLQSMCQKKLLRREKSKLGDKKVGFVYSNW